MRRSAPLFCGLFIFLASCRDGGEGAKVHADAPDAPMQVHEENIVRAMYGELIYGPLISGELQPVHSATIRAEVGGTLVEVRVDEGQRVKRGDLLGRIASDTLENARNSSRSAVRSAEAAVNFAQVEVRRSEELVRAGAVAQRDLDQAQANLASSQAQLANGQSNLVAAEEQLAKSVLRAPLTGVISIRAADAGDVVAVGAELFTVIDPSSVRLEASVPADQLSQVRVGNPVQFTVTGYPEPFRGRVERVTPVADPVTRQIRILVMIPDRPAGLPIGLFAEGRVISASDVGVIVPADAVNLEDRPWVLVVRDGRVERTDVVIGLADDITERLLLKSGVENNDILLRGTDQAITPGTAVDIGR